MEIVVRSGEIVRVLGASAALLVCSDMVEVISRVPRVRRRDGRLLVRYHGQIYVVWGGSGSHYIILRESEVAND